MIFIVLFVLKFVILLVNMYNKLLCVCIFLILDLSFFNSLLFGVIIIIGIFVLINVNGLCFSLFVV